MKKPRWWMPVVLAMLCAAAYHNTFQVPFIFDDLFAILRNPAIRRLWPISAVTSSNLTMLSGRPLISLSLALNYAVGGYEVWGYHLFNLVIHFLNTLLVFAVARRALANAPSSNAHPTQTPWLAWSIAALWMLHPLVTESVTYILQRTELLMGLFLLLTLYTFIRGTESPKKSIWFGLAILSCVLGMGTKEVMVVAPLLVLIYDHTFVARSWRTTLRERRNLYAGLVLGWVVLIGLTLTTDLKMKSGLNEDFISPWNYFAMEWTVVVHYLRLAIWPRGLVLDYSDWPRTISLASALPCVALLIVLFIGAAWAVCRRWWWGFWGAWFFLLLAPTSSFLPLPTEPATERRMYLPLLAVITIVLGGGDRLCRNLWARFRWPEPVRTSIQAGVVMGLALVLGLLTVQRNAQYRTAKSIWADVVIKRPESLRGQANLGLALLDEGKTADAIPHLVQALRIDPHEPILRSNLANALAQSGATNQAFAELQQTLREDPDFAPAHVALADIFAARDDPQAALKQYQAALSINPNEQAAHFNLAQLLSHLGQRDRAIAEYMEVVRLDPRDATAHYNLANLLAEGGREPEAIAHYIAAARFDPHNARSQINLGNLLLKEGRSDEAIAAYTDALHADPNAFKAHNNLAVILANRGDLVHATEHFREAARLNPNAPEVHAELAEVLKQQGLIDEAQRELADADKLRKTNVAP